MQDFLKEVMGFRKMSMFIYTRLATEKRLADEEF